MSFLTASFSCYSPSFTYSIDYPNPSPCSQSIFLPLPQQEPCLLAWRVCGVLAPPSPPPPSCPASQSTFLLVSPLCSSPFQWLYADFWKKSKVCSVLTKPNFPALSSTKTQKKCFPVPQQECCYVPTGLACPTHLLKTFLRPETSLFSWNSLNSYPSFKDLLKCHFLWKNPPWCVTSL